MTVSLVESNIPSPTTAINESNIRPKKPYSTNAIRRCFKKPTPHALRLKGITKKEERSAVFHLARTKCSTQVRELLKEASAGNAAHKLKEKTGDLSKLCCKFLKIIFFKGTKVKLLFLHCSTYYDKNF